MASESPSNTGISVVYEPKGPASPFVDIVLVHGLQGHPRGTWTKTNVGEGVRGTQTPPISDVKAPLDEKKAKRSSLGSVSKLFRRRSRKPDKGTASPSTDSAADLYLVTRSSVTLPIRHATNVSTSTGVNDRNVFWPADLLPRECPCARILTFGYDTKIANYGASSTNKNSIYSHAKDFLFALSRSGGPPGDGPRRPIIFVAHSLGGIVVKEMLARSSMSTEPHLKSIVKSTAAIIFLGTPHRGSPDFAAAGDWVRSFVSFFGAETTPKMLHALGLQTTDLERAQEAFSALWQKYNFRVKTFQEGLGLTGINIAGLGNKVVPDYSSSIGDHREHAETIQANHREMCRFYGPEDPGYRQVSGEVRSVYLSIESLKKEDLLGITSIPLIAPAGETQKISSQQRLLPALKPPSLASLPFSVNSLDLRDMGTIPFSKLDKAYLQALWFPGMNTRRRNMARPTDGTCNWLFKNQEFKMWLAGDAKFHESSRGILQIEGAPGSGKSVLMKEVYRRTLHQYAQSECLIGAFFFNGKGVALEHSINGMLRSFLYQLLPQNREFLTKVARQFAEAERGVIDDHQVQDQSPTCPSTKELEDTLRSLLSRRPRGKRTFLFIDALDESDSTDRASIMTFLGTITMNAITSGIKLNLLISSRHFPLVMLGNCAQIDVDMHNEGDIATYVEWRFNLGIAAQEPQWHQIRDAIVRKAGGVFLWAVLAIDGVIAKWEQGAGLKALLNHLDILPQELFDLFSSLFQSLPPDTAKLTLCLFQWAILSARPLQLQEWHHVLAFMGPQPPPSMRVWRDSDDFTDTDEQLERKIGALSKGLLVIATDKEEPEYDKTTTKSVSEFAGAGSFMMNPGETRVIQAIHGSVHQFFKSSGGFREISQRIRYPEMPEGELTEAQLIDWVYNHDQFMDRIIETSVSGGHIAIMTTCLDYLKISELDALVVARYKASKREATNASIGSPPEVADSQLKEAWDMHEDKDNSRLENDHNGYQSPIGPEGVDTLMWMAGIIDHRSDEEPELPPSPQLPLYPNTRRSSQDSVKSQTLEAYPALLSYAIDELFTHASLAVDYCDEPRRVKFHLGSVLHRLADRKTWNRWLALREELPLIHPLDGEPFDSTKPYLRYLRGIDRRLERIYIESPFSDIELGFEPWDDESCPGSDSREGVHVQEPPTESTQPHNVREKGSLQSLRVQESPTGNVFTHRRHVRKQSSVQSFRSAASTGSRR